MADNATMNGHCVRGAKIMVSLKPPLKRLVSIIIIKINEAIFNVQQDLPCNALVFFGILKPIGGGQLIDF